MHRSRVVFIIRRSVVCTAFLANLTAAPECRAVPIEGDPSLLELIRDAHATHAASFPQGRLVATVKTVDATQTYDARAEVIWSAETTWWECDLVIKQLGEPKPLDDQDGVRMIETPREFLWYDPGIGLMQRIPDRVRGYHDVLKLRPDQVWYCYERHTERPWSWFFDSETNAEVLESFAVEQTGDKITVTRNHTTGETITVVCSLSAGGNVVNYSFTPYPDAPQGVLSAGRTGEFHWVPISGERFQLKSCSFRWYESDPAAPVYSYQMNVEEFDPDFDVRDSQFTVDALELEPGTKIEELGPQGVTVRTTRFGKTPEDPTDKQLDRLADELRERGFASPDRTQEE